MNENTPMTPAQQLFAEAHHNLVYAFLNEKKLPEDEYYDVVVFGYLQAVMDYTSQGQSSRFSFATVAWRKMRFIRFNSVDWKDIYFLTYAQSIESNLMQMILAKEKLNLFMKGDEADMDDIYERFGVDYDLTSLLLYRDIDEDGRFSIRWGEQEIA